MTALLVGIAVLAVLVVAAGVSDRALAGLAEQKATDYAAASLGSGARVRVHGAPFLTQAVLGRYGDVEVTAAALTFGVLSGVHLHAHLVNVRLSLPELLRRRASELPVEQVSGEVVLPYDQLATISRVPGLRLDHRDGRLFASAALPVPGLGPLAQVGGEAVATTDEAGGIWLRVRNVSVAGVSLPGVVLNQLVPALAFPIALPPLPYGLRIERLTPTAAGLQVAGSARAVVLRAPAPAGHPTS